MDLTRREDALKEGLTKNEEETQRWETFKNENKKASENMEMFIKKCNVDVLVPIGGGKAFMPGYLYHTNEILVGHYNGLFSKCSVYKAQEIAKYRLKLAKERLESLRKEKEMFQNKLDVPYTDGVLPDENQQEILEEYDEIKEKLWRDEHKKRVREYRQKEKEQEKIENDEKTHEDVMEILDQLELIEELDEELENLEIDDSDTLHKLMSGEMKLPSEKRRTSHANTNSNVVVGECDKNDNGNSKLKCSEAIELDSNPLIEEVYKKYKSDKLLSKLELDNDFTNNNTIPNLEDFRQRESDEDSDNVSSEEFSDIEKEILNLSTKEKIQYLKMKIKESEKSLDTLKITNIEDYDRKVCLLELRDYLTDRLELLKDQYNDEDDDMNVCSGVENEIAEKLCSNEKKMKKKKISFALQDEIQFIDRNESVENMMQSNEKKEKDVIVLDSNIYSGSAENKNDEKENGLENFKNTIVDRKSLILNEVEKSCNFVSENQSHQDFDLVSKIINSDLKLQRTSFIKFEHSDKLLDYSRYGNNENCTNDNEKIIGSPADIYRMYPEYFTKEFQYENYTDIKISMESQIQNGKTDEKTYNKTCSISVQDKKNTKIHDQKKKEDMQKLQINGQKLQLGTKSILKNKDAVKSETHVIEEKIQPQQQQQQQLQQQQKKKKRTKNKEQDLTYELVVGDIVEKPSKGPESEPLPEDNFIDTHAPKKRISRFKQMRDNSVKTKS